MSSLVTQHWPLEGYDVPDGWELVALQDFVADIQSGFASGKHNREGNGIPHLRPMNVSPDGKIDLSDGRFVDPEKSLLRLRRGDVLFNNTNSPAWVGKTAFIDTDEELAFSNHMTRVRLPEGIDPKFIAKQLQYFCRSGYFQYQCKKHVNQASISRTFLGEATPFMVPPAREQERIVSAIESLQVRSSRAKHALAEVDPLLSQLRQGVLSSAFCGKLTEQWRAENPNVEPAEKLLKRIRTERRERWEAAELARHEAKGTQPPKNWREKYKEPEPVDVSELPQLPDSWCWVPMEELVDVQLGQRRAPEFAKLEEYPYIRAGNITWNGLDLSDVKSMGFATPERLFLAKGDVVLNEASGSKSEVGKPAIWRDELDRCCFQATVLRLRSLHAGLLPEWVYYTRLHDALFAEYAARTPGIGILHLTAKLMRRWHLPLPPTEEQAFIVDKLAEALLSADALTSRAASLVHSLGQLDQTILSKAFRGELVPQDPNDEPATELLARIRARREAAGKDKTAEKKAGKFPRKRETYMYDSLDELREWIKGREKNEIFSFDELRIDFDTEYDSVKDMIFTLLEETPSAIEQVFDRESKKVGFRRSSL